MEAIPILNVPFEHLAPVWFIGVAILANAFPAVPEEVFLLSLGYLAHVKSSVFPFFEIVIFLIIGFCMIDSLVYYLALRGDRVITFLVGKVLRIRMKDKEEYLTTHVTKIVFLSRFLVQLRILGPVTAAQAKLPYQKFIGINFLALCIYVPLVMSIGYYYASSIQKILGGAHALNNIMLGVVITIVFIVLMRTLRTTVKKNL
jgi:membrane protein DedA with SNARE-associated domain